MNALFDLLKILVGSLAETLGLALNLLKRDHRLKAGYSRPSKLLSPRHGGFSVTGDRHLSVAQSRNNMMIVSPSGGGKTTTVSYPSIFNIGSRKNAGSMLINDPSGELLKTQNFLLHQGYQVKILDFGNKQGSLYYNPLHRIRTNADVNKVASMLVRTTSGTQDFWTLKATELIGLCIHHLRATEPPIHRNLANVHHILEVLSGQPGIIEAYFADTSPKNLWSKFLSLQGNSDNTRAGIISSAQAALSFLGEDATLCDLTSTDTFDFDLPRREKVAVFLRCPLGDVQYYSTLLSIFWEQWFSHVFQSLPKEGDRDVFTILDELSSLHLPNLANIISNARKFKSPILGILQSENQLFNNYGAHNGKVVLNNAGVKVYFTGLTDESKGISDTLGTYEYVDDRGILRKRPLMSPDEVRTMRSDQVLVVPNGLRPIKCRTRPFYRQRKMVGYMDMGPPDTTIMDADLEYSVHYIDLDRYRKDGGQDTDGDPDIAEKDTNDNAAH